MSDEARQRGRSGRSAKRAERLAAVVQAVPFITRKLAPYEVLNEEGLALIEHNADTVLQEIGIEFRGDEEALHRWRDAGAEVQGERVRFPRGLCRGIIQKSAPRIYTQHARNPERSVQIGGDAVVFAPNYGSPFVRDLDRGRRYGTIEDFSN
jgi:trimethylamine---corrinoid protein Co-methyltransferase